MTPEYIYTVTRSYEEDAPTLRRAAVVRVTSLYYYAEREEGWPFYGKRVEKHKVHIRPDDAWAAYANEPRRKIERLERELKAVREYHEIAVREIEALS